MTNHPEPNGASPIRAGVYLRLSHDPHGTRLAVMRQEKECRELIERRGWTVADVYEDDDISAFSGKVRPQYRRLLQDVEGGALDAIVSWHPDRLHRSPKELESFIDLVEQSGTAVATAAGGEYDLATASGRMTARVVGAVARHESEHKSERMKAKHRQMAAAGASVGSRRPFGYEAHDHKALRSVTTFSRLSDHREICMDEPALVREATERVLSGGTLRGIVRDWTARGFVGVTGRPWSASTLRYCLVSAGISGRRETKRRGKSALGQITADTLTWPAIISVEDSDRLRALLTDISRRANGAPSKQLLTGKSGTARCGLCGAPMAGKPMPRAGGKVRGMVCCDVPSVGGCGRVKIVTDPVEAIVVEAVLQAVEGGALAAKLETPEDREALDGLARVEEQLIENRRDYSDSIIGRPVWLDEHRRLEARQKAFMRRVETARRSQGLADIPDPLRAAWPSLPLVKRRAVVKALVEAVVIAPGRPGSGFDPDRVTIRWRA